jgi:hypothetical protein
VVITTQPPRKSSCVRFGENARGATGEEAPDAYQQEAPLSGTSESSTIKKGKNPENREPTHPYATVPDAINGTVPGPAARTMTRDPPTLKNDTTYTTTIKVHNPQITKTVYEHAMETPITITQRELLSLSPEVRAQIVNITIKKRVPREQTSLVMIEEVPNNNKWFLQKYKEAQKKHKPMAFTAAACTLSDNMTIIADPYEAYL